MPVTEAERTQFETEGYVVLHDLFSPSDAVALREHFMALREEGSHPGDYDGVDIGGNDPLKRYPRMIHMHRWDAISRDWVLDPKIGAALRSLSGEEPYAVQTMLYFKPAGARGQALHQDQTYLRAAPGTCLAAWMALDPCDEENGCLQVVPGSHTLPLLCTERADTTQSFTDVTVPVPGGMAPVPVRMQPGDVLFFHGLLIHGSFPNTSPDRFRRALIGHYITGNAERVAPFYHPVLRMDGSEVALEESASGGPCGVLVPDASGERIEMRTPAAPNPLTHE
ncbi:MAG: phytanoyl-CoA dioxygenase family protein [Fimbriimonadaceae bacterium]|nr:phytanoyl-CoA dioxygenase family protein [Fimbriimonadaceae bacterium]